MKRLLTFTCLAAAALTATGAFAQAVPPPAAKPPAAEAPPAAPPAAAYTYDPAGRRDPFVSLLGRGDDSRSPGSRPSGIPGLLINEINLRGIVKDRTGFLAMIQGSDSKTYVIRAGDRLLDGSVKSVLVDAVVFSQNVNDPLSLIKQREIRKPLRSSQEGR